MVTGCLYRYWEKCRSNEKAWFKRYLSTKAKLAQSTKLKALSAYFIKIFFAFSSISISTRKTIVPVFSNAFMNFTAAA